MSALKEFANFITLNVVNLAATYERLWLENGENYPTLPADGRIAFARKLIKTVAEACESETSAPLCRLFEERVDQNPLEPRNGELPQPLLEVECLGQTLTPVVTSLEAGKFFWQMLFEVRTAILRAMGSVPIPSPSPSPAGGERGVNKDITNRNQTEGALAQERNVLRTLIDTLPDYIYAKDTESRFIIGNTALARVMGAGTPDHLIGKTDFDFYPQELAEQYYADEQAVIQSGEPLLNREEPTIDLAGNSHWLSTTKVPLRDSHGKIVGLVGTGQDITERKQAEEVSRLTQFTTDRGAIDVVWLGLDARFLYVNDRACRSLGYSREELLSMTIHDIQASPLSPEIWPAHWVELKQRGSFTFETEHRRKNGEIFPVEVTVNYIEFGGKEYNCAFYWDITERKQAEEALRLTQFTTDRAAIDATWSGPDARFLYVNDAACRTLGYSREELLSMTVHDIQASPLSPEVWPAHWVELKQRGSFTFETEHRRKNGEIFPVKVTVNYIEFGGKEYNCAFFEDITERKQLEQQIRGSLEHRARQVQTSTEVAQQISTAVALDDLFRRVVNLVQAQFGYYHVQVYTLVEGDLVLQEGTGEAGRRMREAGHKIALTDEQSLAIRVIWNGEPVLAPDVSQEPAWLPNPLLPETKAELAVPISLGVEVLGVLDVQSDTVGGLNEEDQLLLIGLCGQIAVAIDNRRIDTERERLIGEAERRARREQTIREITERMRAATNLQELAKTTARELGQRLSAGHTLVELGIESEIRSSVPTPSLSNNGH